VEVITLALLIVFSDIALWLPRMTQVR